jgi:5'-nucleotidase
VWRSLVAHRHGGPGVTGSNPVTPTTNLNMNYNLLLSNDDGINSSGLHALANALSKLGKIYIVAPDREQSASSHALSIHRPLRIEKVSENSFSVDGTPTDCINIAINGILNNTKPDIIVSGINRGENLGDDITYSGTVSAAIEGTLLGIPSLAVSLQGRNDFEFEAASYFSHLISSYILTNPIPKDTLINMNIPGLPLKEIKGIKITRQGKRLYNDPIIEKTDPRGKKYYWIGGCELESMEMENSDIEAIKKGFVSITPIKLDMTDYSLMKKLEKDLSKLKINA